MAHYLMGLMRIHDPVGYQAYVDGFDWAHLRRLGGEVLIVDDTAEVLEGEWTLGRIVLIRFPSREAAKQWYDSDEYGRVRGFRWRYASSIVSMHPEVKLDVQD